MVAHSFDISYITEHKLEIGVFKFYNNLVIGEVKEGVQITLDNALPLLALGIEYYNKDKPVVYLSNRKYSYSFDPTMHFEVSKLFPYLKGYGVVTYDELNFRVAGLEQRFLSCPSGVFHSMDEAMNWAWELLHTEKA
ncbi:hypothetical protein ACT6NV_05195 [Robiginitalea sp. IMCC44478]|uniref:hypothetical protein n=1 Tax=Robiginitalea sp. IMCC44478 TaxID=3459122 RepID=UPI004041A766